jgi:transitional endoplasmic reticulum ATPase
VVIATTNWPKVIDAVLLRSGRLDRHFYVPVSDEDARTAILAVHTRGTLLADDIRVEGLAGETEGYVGADLKIIIREEIMAAACELHSQRRSILTNQLLVKVSRVHFEAAVGTITLRVTPEMRIHYDQIEAGFQQDDIAQPTE